MLPRRNDTHMCILLYHASLAFCFSVSNKLINLPGGASEKEIKKGITLGVLEKTLFVFISLPQGLMLDTLGLHVAIQLPQVTTSKPSELLTSIPLAVVSVA